MCSECGCGEPGHAAHVHSSGAHASHDRATGGMVSVPVMTSLLSDNDARAAHNRAHFDQHGVLALNLMSAPGSGKTSLLEATIDALGDRYRIAVIEGDLETENDAARIRAKGVPAVQITTGQACHLDAGMVHAGLHALDLAAIDILFVENVGNLVCPAGFDLGQHANVVLLSTTEGDDKPAKYPVMFRAAGLVLVSKADLIDLLGDFDLRKAEGHLRDLASAAPVLPVSARLPETLAPWLDWVVAQRERTRGHAPAAE